MYIKKASITKAPHKQILVEVAPLIDRFSSQRFIEAPNWLGLSLIEGQRITEYFVDEVSNLLDNDGVKGLELFLSDVCGLDSGPTWLMFD